MRNLTSDERCKLAFEVYHAVYEDTESFEVGTIGADLSYLLAAIINPTDPFDYVDWEYSNPAEGKLYTSLYPILRNNFPPDHSVWWFIDLPTDCMTPNDKQNQEQRNNLTEPAMPTKKPWFKGGGYKFFYGAMLVIGGLCAFLTVRDYIEHKDFSGGAQWGLVIVVVMTLITRFDQVTDAISGYFDGKGNDHDNINY